MSRRRSALAGIFVAMLVPAACGPKEPPPAPTTPAVPAVPLDTKVAWVLRLEQQRQVRDARLTSSTAPASFAPATRPDLELLVRDPEVAVRRRAALAIGRVGITEGVAPLAGALADPDELVRVNAAFGLGNIGGPAAAAALLKAMADPSPLVKARVIESLGFLGDAAAAAAVTEAARECGPWLASVSADDEEWPKDPNVEMCRQALYAFVRLKHWDGLARIVLDANGQPVSYWWPVAFALQRIGNERAAPALRSLAGASAVYSPAFALRGLAALKDRAVVPIALAIVHRSDADVRLKVSAIRALGQLAAGEAAAPLLELSTSEKAPINLRLEAITALGGIGELSSFGALLDLLTHPEPAIRAGAITAAARIDQDGFLTLLSTLPADRHWSVRIALARTLATLPADRVRGAVETLAADTDDRVKGPALEALAAVGTPDLVKRLFDALDAPDFALRASAARLIGDRKLEAGAPSLARAYARGESDAAYDARLAALNALARYGGEDAKATFRRALGDREWPVRARAAELLRATGEAAEPVRPAPLRQPAEFFESDRLLRPPYSPHAFLETTRGVIEIELNIVETPFTSHAFMELARAGFYNGVKVHRLVPNFVIQAGDPRGDGEGGPGFTIRDELAPTPFLRGTVGIALAGRDTGGSQFFITLSPQPHLDARYTAFAKVVKGMEVLDQVAPWDEIRQITIWDGISER